MIAISRPQRERGSELELGERRHGYILASTVEGSQPTLISKPPGSASPRAFPPHASAATPMSGFVAPDGSTMSVSGQGVAKLASCFVGY